MNMTAQDMKVCKGCQFLVIANAPEPCELEARPYNDGSCPYRQDKPVRLFKAEELLTLAREADKKSFAIV